MKKFLSILLATLMVLAMVGTAFADNVTNENTGHTFEVYQIFAANQSSSMESTGEILVTGWGSGVNSTNLLKALQEDTTYGSSFAACTTAADVAGVLSAAGNNADGSAMATWFAKLAFANKGTAVSNVELGDTQSSAAVTLDKGYYLIVDTTTTDVENGATAEGTYKNLSLLQVVSKGDILIKQKNSVPSLEKKVEEDQDGISWNDIADYDIGDAVPFKLTATLPTQYDLYSTYKLVFVDDMDTGLTFNSSTVKVTVDGKELTKDTHYTVDNATNQHFEVTIANLKTISIDGLTITNESSVVVEYTATLNSSCNVGFVGNKNEAYLKYSNNPNVGGEGELGKTPTDVVIVHTYMLMGNKVDATITTQVLSGAKFKVQNNSTGKWIGAIQNEVVTWVDTDAEAMTFTTDTNGQFKIEAGLDDGQYNLKEIEAPEGYALPANPIVKVTITGINTKDDNWNGTTETFDNAPSADDTDKAAAVNELVVTSQVGNQTAQTGNVNGDNFANVTITNTKGGTLPETGGIGTTLFYLFGGLMTAGSALMLVVRRRAEAEEE